MGIEMKHTALKVAVMLTVAVTWMSLDVKKADACCLFGWLFGCKHHNHCDDSCGYDYGYNHGCGYDGGCGHYGHGFDGGCGFNGGCGNFDHGHHGHHGALPAAPIAPAAKAPLPGPQIATCNGPHCENSCSGPNCGCATISTCCGPQANSAAFQLVSHTSGN